MPESQWNEIPLDDAKPFSWLKGPAIRVQDADWIHVYAIRVKPRQEPDYQQAYDTQLDQELEHVLDTVGSRAETTQIKGFPGDYVIYAIPFGD